MILISGVDLRRERQGLEQEKARNDRGCGLYLARVCVRLRVPQVSNIIRLNRASLDLAISTIFIACSGEQRSETSTADPNTTNSCIGYIAT